MMRSIFLLLCCCFVSHLLLAQSRFSFGLNAQTGLSGNTELSESSSSTSTANYYRIRHNVLVPVIGAGAWVSYQLGEKLSLRSGVQYLNSGNTEVRRGNTEFVNLTRPMTFYDYTYRFRVHQLQVPLEIRFAIGKGRVRPILSFGAQLSYDWLGRIYREDAAKVNDKNQAYVLSWHRDEQELYKFRPIHLQPFLGFGLQLNEEMTIRIRQTWAFREQQIYWGRNLFSLDPISIRVPVTYLPYEHQSRSTHLKTTTVELAYRLF